MLRSRFGCFSGSRFASLLASLWAFLRASVAAGLVLVTLCLPWPRSLSGLLWVFLNIFFAVVLWVQISAPLKVLEP